MIVAAWSLAIIALLAVLIGCGVSLGRRFIRLLDAVGEFFSASAILDGVHPAQPERRPMPSVLEPVGEARERREGFRQQSELRRTERRRARLERAVALTSPWENG